MVVARVNVALRYDYLGVGKRTKEGDEKRDVKNRRGEISSGVCRRVWLLAPPQPPPLFIAKRGGNSASLRGKNSYQFLKRHDPCGLFVYSISELKQNSKLQIVIAFFAFFYLDYSPY